MQLNAKKNLKKQFVHLSIFFIFGYIPIYYDRVISISYISDNVIIVRVQIFPHYGIVNMENAANILPIAFIISLLQL